jgi:hypothetical protein
MYKKKQQNEAISFCPLHLIPVQSYSLTLHRSHFTAVLYSHRVHAPLILHASLPCVSFPRCSSPYTALSICSIAMASPYFPPTASQATAYKPQNPRVPSSTSSDASSSHQNPPRPKPAYLPRILCRFESHDTTTRVGCVILDARHTLILVQWDSCRHQSSFFLVGSDASLQIISKEPNLFEVTIAGSRCYTSRAALEATFAGRWMLSSLSDNRLAFLLWGRIFENQKQVEPLHLSETKPGEFLICGSICPHNPVALKEDLELTWGGRLFLIQQRPIHFLHFAWKDIKAIVSHYKQRLQPNHPVERETYAGYQAAVSVDWEGHVIDWEGHIIVPLP